ncbi:MAG TPA: hypothetical protein VKE70_29020 [Candidatus Solibacter sp.]|nr:hypothetical protein [Candidatus Solibacter sp.]
MSDVLQAPMLELFEKYSIIRSTVASWQEAQQASKALQKAADENKPYLNMERDRDKVVGYSQALVRSSRGLAAAVCLTSDLLLYADGPNESVRMEVAIRALSEGLELASLSSEDQRTEALIGCASDLPGDTVFPYIDPSKPAPTIVQWKERVGQKLKEIQTARRPDNLTDLQVREWRGWDARLAGFVQSTAAKPDLDYLRCHAAGLMAATILPARLSGPGIVGRASEALVAALDGSKRNPPALFAVGLLEALGFDVSKDTVREVFSQDVHDAFFQRRSAATMVSPKKGLIIVRQVSGSRTAQWQLMKSEPVLVLPLNQWKGLFEGRFDLRRYLEDRLAGVLFEADGQEPLKNTIERFQSELVQIRQYVKSVQGGLMLPRNPMEDTKMPQELQRCVIAPPNQAAALKAFQTTATP